MFAVDSLCRIDIEHLGWLTKALTVRPPQDRRGGADGLWRSHRQVGGGSRRSRGGAGGGSVTKLEKFNIFTNKSKAAFLKLARLHRV